MNFFLICGNVAINLTRSLEARYYKFHRRKHTRKSRERNWLVRCCQQITESYVNLTFIKSDELQRLSVISGLHLSCAHVITQAQAHAHASPEHQEHNGAQNQREDLSTSNTSGLRPWRYPSTKSHAVLSST